MSNVTFFFYQTVFQDDDNKNTGNLYITYYNQATASIYTPQWTQIAKQSDLTALSNSVVKTLDNVAPVNNNINMWNWFHRYPYTDFTNGMTTIEWVNKGLFSCYFSGESQTFPQKPTDWGQLINIPASSPNSGASEAFQLFVAQANGDIYYRGTNQNTQLDEVPFKRLTYVGEGWTISKGTNGWARESSTGFTIQWGSTGTLSGTATISFPRTFSTVYQVIPVGNVEETNENWGFPLNEKPTTKNFKASHWYSGQWRYIAVGIS